MARYTTVAEAAQAALDVQNACNLSGVVKSFDEVMEPIRAQARELGQGTDWINQHPIVQLFADKLVDLARVRDYAQYSKAYGACRRMVANPASDADLDDTPGRRIDRACVECESTWNSAEVAAPLCVTCGSTRVIAL